MKKFYSFEDLGYDGDFYDAEGVKHLDNRFIGIVVEGGGAYTAYCDSVTGELTAQEVFDDGGKADAEEVLAEGIASGEIAGDDRKYTFRLDSVNGETVLVATYIQDGESFSIWTRDVDTLPASAEEASGYINNLDWAVGQSDALGSNREGVFSEMIRDFLADHAPEYDDLIVDDPELVGGKWIATANDGKSTYELSDGGDGNIIINYIGTI